MRPLASTAGSRGGGIIATACLLAMLWFGRDLLAPIALAAILSLVIAPLKRKLARMGLGHTAGASGLPQYKEAIRAKLERARDLTIRPLERMQTEMVGVVPQTPASAASRPRARAVAAAAEAQAAAEDAAPRLTAADTLRRIFSSLWGPVGQAGIVLVLLVFILLEHEDLLIASL
jgi:predicted PurR-regulated permease PerM